MLRRACWLGVVIVVLGGRADAANAPPLAVSAEVMVTDAVRVAVTIENTSATAFAAVEPEMRYRLAERRGEPAALAPGERHLWNVEFPSPAAPSGDVLIVLVRWHDAEGHRHSQPYARVVDTAGLLPTEAQVLVQSEPAAGHERALGQFTNATSVPLRARLVALMPEEFLTTPEAQPIDVPPRETLAVPIDVQSRGPAGTTYPLQAVVQFTQGGIPRTIVASTLLGIGVTPDRSIASPLLVGFSALAVAVVGLLAALRMARRRQVDGMSGPP
jgi:hypothetical protein